MSREQPLSMDSVMKGFYAPQLRAALVDQPGSLMAKIAEEHRARWDALTPEQQEVETLKARIGELEHRLDHARRALDGDDCEQL